jgi:nucleotide-binding universal stress UspA family protein
MSTVKKILLAIHQAQWYEMQWRAILLASHLNLPSFDVIALKRQRKGLLGLSTGFGHIQVEHDKLSAVVNGAPQRLATLVSPDDVDHTWASSIASAAQVIASTAEQIGADLTILGGPTPNLLNTWIGSPRHAEIVRLCRSAVLVVNATPLHRYRKVVIAIDFSRASLAAAPAAFALAPRAEFVFVHVHHLPDEPLMRELELAPSVIRAYREHGLDGARARLDEYLRVFLPGVAEPSRIVLAGARTGEAIIDCARRERADLIVAGKARHGRRWPAAGSAVVRRLLEPGDCDVLIGPDQFGDDHDTRLAA